VLDLFSGMRRRPSTEAVASGVATKQCLCAPGCVLREGDRRRGMPEPRLLAELARCRAGWRVHRDFCVRAGNAAHNGARVDAIRARIAHSGRTTLEGDPRHSLMEAAEQGGFGRPGCDGLPQGLVGALHQPLQCDVPELLDGREGLSWYRRRGGGRTRRRPTDTPTTKHSYLGLFMSGMLVRGEKPEVYGVDMKRTDVPSAAASSTEGDDRQAVRHVSTRLRCAWRMVTLATRPPGDGRGGGSAPLRGRVTG